MAEPTVQVPVSMIERASNVLEGEGYPSLARHLRLRLSQPTPTAEPCTECQYVEGHRDDCGRLDDYLAHRDDAAPPSIADMVPGTTFWASEVCGDDQQFQIGDGGRILPSLFWTVESHNIDPSTIRDVTPPSTESTK